jgi:hypothetical protein
MIKTKVLHLSKYISVIGACSNIKFTDIITKNMTDKDWKDLCHHERHRQTKNRQYHSRHS